MQPFLIIILTLVVGEGVGLNSEIYFSSLNHGRNSRYSLAPVQVIDVRSKLDCSQKCNRMLNCKSYNFIKTDSKCEILNGVPLNPRDLTPDLNSFYMEKSCQPFLHMTAANFDVHTGNPAIYVVVDGGINTIKVLFNASTLDIFSIAKSGTSSVRTGGTVKNIRNVGYLRQGSGPTAILINDKDIAIQFVNFVFSSGTWPRESSDIFGPVQVRALISNVNDLGFYAFTYDRVSNVATPDQYQFIPKETFVLSDFNSSNPWINAPVDIIGAAWIYPASGQPQYAFLANNFYYVVINRQTTDIIKRNQICRDADIFYSLQ